jgi:hypothetical protein
MAWAERLVVDDLLRRVQQLEQKVGDLQDHISLGDGNEIRRDKNKGSNEGPSKARQQNPDGANVS